MRSYACKKRLGKDHEDATRCPTKEAKINKRKNSGSKKNQGKSQMSRPGQAKDRALRPRLDHNYAEPDSDDANMEEDSDDADTEEDSEVLRVTSHASLMLMQEFVYLRTRAYGKKTRSSRI